MNPKKGGGKASYAATTSSSSPKGKSVTPQFGHSSGGSGFGNSPKSDQLIRDVAGLSIDTPQDDGWAVFSKKNKNRGGTSATKQWGSTGRGNTRVPGGAWQSQPADFHGSTAGRGTKMVPSSDRGLETSYRAPPPVVAPPLKQGWQWNSRPNASAHIHANRQDFGPAADGSDHQGDADVDDEDDDLMEDTDDDLLSDDFDSDDSAKSHGTRRRHKWFKDFFEVLDKLKVEEINEPSRQWHCPACKNGPGAIDWYRGLQPLMAHAKTKGAKRVKVHRELAEILDEELSLRGTSVVPSGEVFGKWRGLRETVSDREIVWPPMVMVRNTLLDKDENEKWIGMGNQELLDYFSGYNAVKARHSYGPQGHRGISLLIFENSAIGYVEAERLHKHFADQGTDRDAWDHRKVLFLPGGTRQLYGYMASNEDLDNFNQHCQGKMKLKFEMRSHHEMVVIPMKQMDEDNQQLVWLKNKVVKEKKNSKALQESYGKVAEKLRETLEENRIVRQRTKMQHEQNKEEMDYQEQFFKDQINHIHQTLEEKERAFEELLQQERKKMQQSIVNSSANEELRQEEISKFIQTEAKGIEEFEAERENLIRILEGEKAEIKRKYLEEEVEVEKKFDTALTELMKKYSPQPSTEQD